MEISKTSAFEIWEPFSIRPQIFSIIIVFLILSLIILYYFIYMKKLKPNQPIKGFAFFIFNIINFFKVLVFEITGKKFIKFTPYIVTLFSYIVLSNLLSLIGLENPTSTTSVTFLLGIITVFGSIFTALRYQKSRFFLKFMFKFTLVNKKTKKETIVPYMFNPYGLVEYFAQLLSISFRLWGNIFAGALIISLFYGIPMVIFQKNPLILEAGPEILISSLFAVPIHAFLDLLVAVIQAFVFVVLTLSYWGNEIPDASIDNKLIGQYTDDLQIGFDELEGNQIKVKLKNKELI